MLILECSQECYGRTDGWKEGRKEALHCTISLCNFVVERIIINFTDKFIDLSINELKAERSECPRRT